MREVRFNGLYILFVALVCLSICPAVAMAGEMPQSGLSIAEARPGDVQGECRLQSTSIAVDGNSYSQIGKKADAAYAANGDPAAFVVMPEDDDPTDAELTIRIDYVPVPKGENAYLAAVPNNKVGASQFNYTWEISENDGKTWKVYNDDSVQTLRVLTDDPPAGHVGHLFRVILTTDLIDTDGTYRGATSNPITLKASDEPLGFTVDVVSDYSSYKVNLINYDEAVDGKVTYIWEMGSGNDWVTIPGSTNSPTLNSAIIPFKSPDSVSSGNEPVDLTYFRVRLITESGKTCTSNSWPLAVRVGESGDPGKQGKSDVVEVINKTIVPDPESAWLITSAKSITKTFGCKPFKLTAKAKSGGKLSFASSNKKVATIGKTTGKVTVRSAGKTTITITAAAKGSHPKAVKNVTLTVKKAKNTVMVKTTPKSVMASKVKGNSATVKPIKVTKAQGKVTYSKVSKGSSKRLVVNKKTGKVTIKKGTRKGSYKLKVKVKAAGNGNYKALSKTVMVRVQVK